MAYQKKMSVIESAEKRMNDELRQHDLGLDNADDIRYWAAYLDGARAQQREDKSRIADLPLCGYIVVLGVSGDELADCPLQLAEWKKMLVRKSHEGADPV